ncbi:hypothetical protein [Clostridium tarantellae]|uniref:Uncharacterized protein n=1 Tax=Clostridium tarantellae TaxID=39493 RepID=A0A6I1MJC9_9CLOT|nr:hypothetical protein [Clostridium tarantellae]MPQ43044.1 hypothetical protein [Clostridium tarantellae]
MKYIDFLNNSLVSIKMKIFYYVPGKQGIQSTESPIIKTGIYKTVSMPDNTYSILIRMFFEDSKGLWKEFGNTSLASAINKCYEIFGSESKINFHEIDCSKLRGFNYAYFVNKSENLLKGVLSYTLKRESYKEETKEIKKYKEVFLNIPADATNIIFTLFVLEKKTFSKDVWHQIINERIAGRIPKVCYEITGKWPNIIAKKIQCPPENSVETLLGFNGSTNENNLNPENTKIIKKTCSCCRKCCCNRCCYYNNKC